MEDNIYWKMFQNCTALTECPQFTEKPIETNKQTIDIKFDGFDWDTDFKNAYEE